MNSLGLGSDEKDAGRSVGSLFSGIGGFDLGLEQAGFRVAWQVEKDKACRSVLRRHFPGVDLHEDVRNVGSANLSPVDVICGGFPCQDLSVAGRRAGLGGERSGLWFEFLRVVSELAPRWVLIENVPGLRSSAGGRDLAVILRGLAQLGYVGAWRSLDSRHFGVAQRRERIFLLACRDPGAGSPAQVLAIPEGLSGHPAPGRQAGEGIAGSAEGGAGDESGLIGYGQSGNGYHRPEFSLRAHPGGIPENIVVPKLAGTLEARREAGGFPGTDGACAGHVVAHTLRSEGHDASEDGTGRGVPLVVGYQQDVFCEPRGLAFATIPRRLTPIECERLQGFPDGWTASGVDGPLSDSARYRMLGNAVTATVAYWLGTRLLMSRP